MDTLTLVILLAALGLAVLVGGGLTLLRGRRSRPRPGKAALPPLTDLEERPGERAAEPSGDVKVVAPGEPGAPTIPTEKPAPVAGRMARLRSRFGGSQATLGRGLLGLLSKERLDDAVWEEVEEVLLTADVGVGPTQELVERLRTRVKELGSRDTESVRALLREELLTLVGPDADRSLHTTGADGRPAVVLVVGVNGTGKTTTVGKLARVLVAADHVGRAGRRAGGPRSRGR
jgi:fused signal recognition particle receptor